MDKERFDCCFENDYEGIYFEIERLSDKKIIELKMFNKFKFETSVCLRENDINRLISFLQNVVE